MKRAGLIIVLSLAFFAAELAAVLHYQDQITEYIAGFAKSDDWLNDDKPWGWGMSLANRVRRSNHEERKVRTYLLGGSTAVKFFAQNKMLSQIPGVAVYNLTLPRQNMFEKLMLVDAVQRQATPGLVVLTTHPIALAYDKAAAVVKTHYFNGENYRYGLRSPLADQYYASQRWEFAPPLKWKALRSANHLFSLVKQTIDSYAVIEGEVIQRYLVNPWDKAALEEEPLELRELSGQINHRRKGYTATAVERSLNMLDWLARACRERNLRLVVFELPLGDVYRQVAHEEVVDFRARMERFTAQHPNVGLYRIPLAFYDGRECLFEDSVHVTEEGSRLFACPFMALLRDRILPDAGVSLPTTAWPAGDRTCPEAECPDGRTLKE